MDEKWEDETMEKREGARCERCFQYEKMSSWLAMSQLVRSMARWYAAMSDTRGGVLSESGLSGMYISRIRIGAVF